MASTSKNDIKIQNCGCISWKQFSPYIMHNVLIPQIYVIVVLDWLFVFQITFWLIIKPPCFSLMASHRDAISCLRASLVLSVVPSHAFEFLWWQVWNQGSLLNVCKFTVEIMTPWFALETKLELLMTWHYCVNTLRPEKNNFRKCKHIFIFMQTIPKAYGKI